MTFTGHELMGEVGLLLLFVTVIAVSEFITRKGWLAPEPARKSIHLMGGLGCLLFPFVVSSWVSVLFLSSVFAVVFYLGENKKMLKSLSSVKRKGVGSLLFPVSILLLYIMSNGRIWMYIAGLLVLVLADTAAALTGTRFGKILYKTAPDQSKSLEGTLMFALVGFFSIVLPLLFLSNIPHINIVLTAFLMSLLLAGLEAVSIGGTDNLFVPVTACFLLLKVPEKPAAEILFQCISLLGIAFSVFAINRHYKTLQLRPLIIFGLITYTTWSLGAADWMIPLICLFVVYNRICDRCAALPPDLSALELLRPFYPQLVIIFAANALMTLDFWFAPFLVANAVAVALCIIHRFAIEQQPCRPTGLRLAATALLPPTVPLLLCIPFQGISVLRAAPVITALCALTTLTYNRFVKLPLAGFAWNYAVPIASTTAALAYAGIQYVGWVPLMEPTMWMEVFRCQ